MFEEDIKFLRERVKNKIKVEVHQDKKPVSQISSSEEEFGLSSGRM